MLSLSYIINPDDSNGITRLERLPCFATVCFNATFQRDLPDTLPARKVIQRTPIQFKCRPTQQQCRKLCKKPHCRSSAQTGGLCKLHGGTRCNVSECTSVARKSGLCARHGGRSLCHTKYCKKTAHRGGHCISHDGGRRCEIRDCLKSAKTRGLCFAHGGGRRCILPDCDKGARRGPYCRLHKDYI